MSASHESSQDGGRAAAAALFGRPVPWAMPRGSMGEEVEVVVTINGIDVPMRPVLENETLRYEANVPMPEIEFELLPSRIGPTCAGCGKQFFIGLRPAHTHCRSCDPAHYANLPPLPLTDAERYAFVRRLSPRAFADLHAANIRGEGSFDDLVDAAIRAERAT